MKVPVAGLIRDLVVQAIARVNATPYKEPIAPKPPPEVVAQADIVRQLRSTLKDAERKLRTEGWSVNSYDGQRLSCDKPYAADAHHAFDRVQKKRLSDIRELDTSLRMDMIGKDVPELASMLKEFQTTLRGI